MTASTVKSIRALARGLEVLHLLQVSGALTLADLHRRSGIPKATLLRILKTLMEQGVVWQRMLDGAYAASFSLADLAGRMDRENALVEVASPLLEALTSEVKWPSVLAVPRPTHMEVIETNARRAYFGDIPLGPLGFKVNMLRSASGRAYVAFCEDAVRDAILDRLRRSDLRGDRLARNPDYVARLLRDTRARGFALRDPDFGGDFDADRSEMDDERESMAMPIRLGRHVPGVVNLTWSRRALDRAAATARFADPLARAVDGIAQRFIW